MKRFFGHETYLGTKEDRLKRVQFGEVAQCQGQFSCGIPDGQKCC